MVRIIISFILALMLQSSLYAVNIPSDATGSEKFDMLMCVKQYQDICINSVCSSSESRDCPDKCKKLAEDKCNEKLKD